MQFLLLFVEENRKLWQVLIAFSEWNNWKISGSQTGFWHFILHETLRVAPVVPKISKTMKPSICEKSVLIQQQKFKANGYSIFMSEMIWKAELLKLFCDFVAYRGPPECHLSVFLKPSWTLNLLKKAFE